MPNPYAPPDPSAPPPPQRRPEDYRRPEENRETNHGTPGPGGRGDQQPGRRPAPTPEEAMAAGRSVLKFGAALLVALLAMQWPVPWQVVAPIAGAGAVYLGIRALIAYRRFGASMFTWVFLVIGVGMSVLLTLASLSLLTMWDAQATHQRCMDRALTVQAEQACTDAYEQALQDRISLSET